MLSSDLELLHKVCSYVIIFPDSTDTWADVLTLVQSKELYSLWPKYTRSL